MLTVGSPAPDFALADDSGDTVRLSALKGRQVVVYFYPRDDTPGSAHSPICHRRASRERLLALTLHTQDKVLDRAKPP